MATLGTFRNKPPAETKTRKQSNQEEGTLYIDSYGNWYKAPEITADKIAKYLDNIYARGSLDRLQRMVFNEKFTIEAIDEKGEVDTDVSLALTKMVEHPEVRLWHITQRAWRDTAEWGPSLLNPVWDYVDNEYRLIKLRRLPPQSFSQAGTSQSYVKNKILPGILLNSSTNEVEYWQRQIGGRIEKLENVWMITDPLTGELGGSPLILPIIPLLAMLDFAWSSRMQQNHKLGAGGLFFIKVTNPKGDDKKYAQRILQNVSKNTAFQLRENMEVVSVPISETGTAGETIEALSKLIIEHFSPASSIAKDGQILGGSSGPEWQMYQSYIRGIHTWLEEAFEQLLQEYLDVNQYDGYTINITIPSPTIDKSEFILKALDTGEKYKRLLPEESRTILTKLGLDLPELDDAGLSELKSQEENSATPDGMTPKLQKARAVAEIVKACDLDPTHLISEEDAKAIVNQALGIEEKKEFYQGGPGSGNFGHGGRPGERGGSQSGGAISSLNIWGKQFGSARVEHAAIYDKEGNEIFKNDGEKKNVGVKVSLLKDAHVIHNHPSGCAGFSMPDINLTIKGDAASMSVAVADGTIVTLERPENGWPEVSKDELNDIHKSVKIEVAKERNSIGYKIRSLFKRGKSDVEIRHEYNQEVSRRVLSNIGLKIVERKING